MRSHFLLIMSRTSHAVKTGDNKRSKNVAGLKNTKILFVSQVLQCIKWSEHNCI